MLVPLPVNNVISTGRLTLIQFAELPDPDLFSSGELNQAKLNRSKTELPVPVASRTRHDVLRWSIELVVDLLRPNTGTGTEPK